MGERSTSKSTGKTVLDSRFAMFEVRSHDPDLRRKGHVLAIILSGLLVVAAVLATFNSLNGDTQHYVINVVFIFLLLGLFMLNRFGFVRLASMVVVAFNIAEPFTIFDDPTAMFMTMTIP